VKDTKDAAIIKRFADRFPNKRRRIAVESRPIQLTRTKAALASPQGSGIASPKIVSRDVLLQAAEDKDVLGCFQINDISASECRSALERYPLISYFTYDYRFRFTLCQALGDACGGKRDMLLGNGHLQAKALFNPANTDLAVAADISAGVLISSSAGPPAGSGQNSSSAGGDAAGTSAGGGTSGGSSGTSSGYQQRVVQGDKAGSGDTGTGASSGGSGGTSSGYQQRVVQGDKPGSGDTGTGASSSGGNGGVSTSSGSQDPNVSHRRKPGGARGTNSAGSSGSNSANPGASSKSGNSSTARRKPLYIAARFRSSTLRKSNLATAIRATPKTAKFVVSRSPQLKLGNAKIAPISSAKIGTIATIGASAPNAKPVNSGAAVVSTPKTANVHVNVRVVNAKIPTVKVPTVRVPTIRVPTIRVPAVRIP
jgi:hypothetical protein